MITVISFALLVIATIVLVISVVADKKITKEEQERVSLWLNFVIAEAEDLYGKDAGKAKLFYVYKCLCEQFPRIAKVMPIDTLSAYVDKVKASTSWKEIAEKMGIEVE